MYERYGIDFERLNLLHLLCNFLFESVSGSSVLKHQIPSLAKLDININNKKVKRKKKDTLGRLEVAHTVQKQLLNKEAQERGYRWQEMAPGIFHINESSLSFSSHM